ncbi:MAG: hypothetical protein JJ895_12095 [Balneolaceae bacterium]|nr:hypothetical protein [Balneolaceae bacterium]
MSRKYKFLDQHHAFFVSFVTMNWVDVFTRSVYCDQVVESSEHWMYSSARN